MKAIILSVALALTATPALSMETDLYFGWGVGQSSFDSMDVGILDGFDDASYEDGSTSFKLFVGNRFNENIALEVGYVDLGETSMSASYNDTVNTKYQSWVDEGSIDVSADASALFANVKLSTANNNGWTGFAKIGVASMSGDFSGSGSFSQGYNKIGYFNDVTTEQLELSGEGASDTGAFFGVGVSYRAFLVEAEWFDGVSSISMGFIF